MSPQHTEGRGRALFFCVLFAVCYLLSVVCCLLSAGMLEARTLHKTYRNGAVPLTVLNGVSVAIAEGEFVAITGPSGAGK